ncbi:regulatory protein Swi6p [Monosporozyma unispora]|nr:transcriptional regulator swi6 [Kazachstania unispora]
MAIIDIVGYLNTETTISFKQNTENGYVTLKPFLPILDQLNDFDQDDTTNSTFTIDSKKLQDSNESDIDSSKENSLLTKFGVLVDTDANGDKWITGDKAILILKKSNLFELFKDKLQSDQSHSSSIKDGEVEDSENDDNNTNNNKLNPESITASATKRGKDSPQLDHQRELGSPLKKMKLSHLSNKLDSLADVDLDSNKLVVDSLNDNVHDEANDNNNAIPLFKHDLDFDIIKTPLSIQRTRTSSTVMDKDERMKLETFLQKLLFPSDENDETSSFTSIESLLQELDVMFPHVSLNLNIPVDEHGNTPLHWLTSIANLNLVKELVKIGSNRLMGDNNGESPLIKAVKSVNNYDSGTFEELLDYLYPCLVLEDYMNRTVLHHIVITSGMAGCSSAARYYLDILMGWIVKKDARQGVTKDGIVTDDTDPILKNLTLNWVLTNMLNVQDSNGDTCLNIAARLGNVGIVDALLEYGADPFIANKSGLRPADFGARTTTKNAHEFGSNDGSNDENIDKQNNVDDDLILTQHDEHNNGNNNNNNNNDNNDENNNNTELKLEFMKEPDTMSLINDMKTLLANVTKDYEDELSEHKDKLSKLHNQLNSQRHDLTVAREKLQNAKQLNDEYNLLKEQLTNLQKGIEEEETNFIQESQKLGISAEETQGIDWDSGEFDADEPFRVELIYDFLENKLNNEYDGDVEKLLNEESVENVMKQIRSSHSDEDILNALPPAVLLKARINAYKRNDEHLQNMLSNIHEKQSNLEGKFRRVLSLCLKVDETKVDGMLDGLLQAISSEDPQDMDTGEMQDFLNKHAIA